MKNTFSKLTLAVALLFAACKPDFLERSPKGSLTFDTFFETEEHAVWATNAIYAQLRTWDCVSFPWLGATDILSDDAEKGSSPNDALYMEEMNAFTFDATNTVPTQLWKGHFHLIFRANLAIENIPKINMDDALKNRLVGEAKFLRGYAYLRLVQWFGGVPLVLKQLEESEFFTQKRASKEAVFAQIEADFRDAAAVLPKKSLQKAGDRGRATQGAAEAMLAKTFLAKGDFAAAEPILKSLVESGEYSLLPKFQDNFLPVGENAAESIFEITAVATNTTIAGPGASPYNMVQGVRGVPNLGWGFNAPSLDLVAAFETGDPRRNHTILKPGDQLPDGSAIVENNPDILDSEERYNKKAWVATHPGLQDNGPGNIRIIRFADVLLLYAEVLNENGKPNDALPFLNQVRKRARGSNNFILQDVTTTDQTALREKIRHERRVELAMEQNRWFDLARWGKTSILKTFKPNFSENKNELLPVPQTEIDLAPNLEQNAGY